MIPWRDENEDENENEARMKMNSIKEHIVQRLRLLNLNMPLKSKPFRLKENDTKEMMV